MTEETVKEMIRLHEEEKMQFDDIARMYGMKMQTAYYYIRKYRKNKSEKETGGAFYEMIIRNSDNQKCAARLYNNLRRHDIFSFAQLKAKQGEIMSYTKMGVKSKEIIRRILDNECD